MQENWESAKTVDSAVRPGVRYRLRRMSFGRRLELMKRVRELAARAEFFEAGREESNRMEASLLGGEMDRLFLEWGLETVTGLHVDGEPASVAALVERGPEDLAHEALALVKAECGLTEAERKN